MAFRMMIGTVIVLMPSCGDEALRGELAAGEQQLIELGQRLKLMEYRAELADTGTFGELRSLEEHLRAISGQISDMAARRAELEASTARLEDELAEAKALVIRDCRERAIGREFDPLVVRDGRSFARVRVVSVDDAGVSIRHEHGAARLRYQDLTAAQQLEFGMDADLAAAAERRERDEIAAYDEWLETEMARAEEAEARKPQESARSLATAGMTSRRVTDEAASGRTSLLAQPARPFGTGSIYGSSRYRSYRPSYRYVYYYQPYCPTYQRYPRQVIPPNGVTRPVVPYRSP